MIEKHFRALTKHPCWGVHWEPQVNMSMSFGAPRLVIREPRVSKAESARVRRLSARRVVSIRGRWWVWLYCSRWTLSVMDLSPVRSTSSMRRIREALGLLDGQRITAVNINPVDAQTRFLFDLGAELTVRSLAGSGSDDLWSLYKPGGHVLSVRGDGTFSHGPGNMPDEYRPISSRRR